MRKNILLLTVGALILLALLCFYLDPRALGVALRIAGWQGVLAVTLAHLPSMTLCAWAWRYVIPLPWTHPRGFAYLIWLRWIRDGTGNVLPILPISGHLVAIRLLAFRHVDVKTAAAGLVVDTTLEFFGILSFSLCGLLLLAGLGTGAGLLQSSLLGAGIAAILLALLIGLQVFDSSGLLQRMADSIAHDWLGSVFSQASEFHGAIREPYRQRWRISVALVTHFLACVLGAAETLVGLRLLGFGWDWRSAVILESLVYAIRTAVFFIPAAVGVQESAFIAIGAVLGLPAEQAFVLAMLKRGREILLGVPAVFAWQLAETRHARGGPVARE